MHDLTTPEGVAAHMSESTSEADWNKRCQKNGGRGSGYCRCILLVRKNKICINDVSMGLGRLLLV